MYYNLRNRKIMKSLSQKKKSKKKTKHNIIFFDLETTGFNPYSNEIIEIAAKKISGETFHELIRPKRNIPEKITAITHITNDMVRRKSTIKKILQKFIDFCGKNPILVAHNCYGFDQPYLSIKLKQNDLSIDNIQYFDTLRLAQYLLPHRTWGYSLKSLCFKWDIEQKNAHRADSDVDNLEEIYLNLLDVSKKKYNTTDIFELKQFIDY